MTLGEIRKHALLLIDEYKASATGYTDDEDIRQKLSPAINLAVKTVARFAAPPVKSKEYFISKKYLSAYTPFDVWITYIGGEITLRGLATAYCFTVDAPSVVKIYRGGACVKTITHASRQTATYKGFITGEGIADMVFSGNSVYNLKNACLYKVDFAKVYVTVNGASVLDESVIPDYSGEYPLPSGFVSLVSARENGKRIDLNITNDKLIIPPSDYPIKVEYRYLPEEITSESADDVEIGLPIDAESAIVYGAVADVLKTDGSVDYRPFESKFNSLLEALTERAPRISVKRCV